MAKCAMPECKKQAMQGSTLCKNHAEIASMPSMNSGKRCKHPGCRKVPANRSAYCADHQEDELTDK